MPLMLNSMSEMWIRLLPLYLQTLNPGQRENPWKLWGMEYVLRTQVYIALAVFDEIGGDFQARYVGCHHCNGTGRKFFGYCDFCNGCGVLLVRGRHFYPLEER